VPNWVYWAIPIAVISGLLLYLLGNRVGQVAQQPTSVANQSVVAGGVDIAKQVGDSLGELRTSLQGITNAASATAAVPKLQGAAAQIDKVRAETGQLSADQRNIIAGVVAPAMSGINPLIDKVLAMPDVGEVVKPVIDTLKTKLAGLPGEPSTTGGR
jgi:hypothetical protein